MRVLERLGWVAMPPFFALACADASDVRLTAVLDNAEIRVEEQVLGPELSGRFDVELALGELASDGTEVSFETFSLLAAADGSELVSPLSIALDVPPPVVVGKAESVTVHAVIEGGALLDADRASRVCAGPVRIVGALTDSLSGGGTTTLESDAIVPECP